MFLSSLIKNNLALIDYSFKLARDGDILPDTYVLDLDNIISNGKCIKQEADKYNIDLYFMLKQIGRNPLVGKALMDIGFKGAVCVDYKEALCMIDNDIHICNVGHLEQIPTNALNKILSSNVDYVTVYSLDKIKEINDVCKKLNINQKLLIRLTDDDAHLYSGQIAGFNTNYLDELISEIDKLSNVSIGGLTIFPGLLYDSSKKQICKTENINALNRGIEICKRHNLNNLNINIPSASCSASMKLIHELGGTSAEPGHGLTGTTPLHKDTVQKEKVGYCYVSEISHNFKDKAYCYGGGTYRRGHMQEILVGDCLANATISKVSAPDMDSIDYHFEIDKNYQVGKPCIMCFRTQVFTTRSHVAVVSGIQKNSPKILGLYDPFGKKIEKNW